MQIRANYNRLPAAVRHLRPNSAGLEKIIVSPSDPVMERIAAYPWPRGGVSVRKLRRGYSNHPPAPAPSSRSTMLSISSPPSRHSGSAPDLTGA
jgi:hypothetical protein